MKEELAEALRLTISDLDNSIGLLKHRRDSLVALLEAHLQPGYGEGWNSELWPTIINGAEYASPYEMCWDHHFDRVTVQFFRGNELVKIVSRSTAAEVHAWAMDNNFLAPVANLDEAQQERIVR